MYEYFVACFVTVRPVSPLCCQGLRTFDSTMARRCGSWTFVDRCSGFPIDPFFCFCFSSFVLFFLWFLDYSIDPLLDPYSRRTRMGEISHRFPLRDGERLGFVISCYFLFQARFLKAWFISRVPILLYCTYVCIVRASILIRSYHGLDCDGII